MKRATTEILALAGTLFACCGGVWASEQVQPKQLIVPGVSVGDFKLGMSKDDVLTRLGKPCRIFSEGEEFSLDDLPRRYFMAFDDLSFLVVDGSVEVISVRSPLYYIYASGLGVGDSEEKIREAYGYRFEREEHDAKDLNNYRDWGMQFGIHKKNRKVIEIDVYQPERTPMILTTLPRFDPDSTSPFQVDLRSRDLTLLDLRNSKQDLMYAIFNDRTSWPAPDRMPSGFDWKRIMELGKDPGLGVRSLHKRGITGRGVRVAIIDQPLLVDHQEYAERLRFYEEIDLQGRTMPAMHGAGVASIALGKTVGVAPEAELYYTAMHFADENTARRIARSINRILEVNEQLPKDNKIRVISISNGWSPSHEGYEEVTEAAQKARAAGMLVACVCVERVHERFDFGALGRSPLADPDVFESYEPGFFLTKFFWADRSAPSDPSSSIGFWVPMDARTTASETGNDEYFFCPIGGFSWAVPYIAGLYALAVQADSAITPERFWTLAARTGRTIEIERSGERKPLGPIVDPVRLIGTIEAGESSELKQRLSDGQTIEAHRQPAPEAASIVPGARIGDYWLGANKDTVLESLGAWGAIHKRLPPMVSLGCLDMLSLHPMAL